MSSKDTLYKIKEKMLKDKRAKRMTRSKTGKSVSSFVFLMFYVYHEKYKTMDFIYMQIAIKLKDALK